MSTRRLLSLSFACPEGIMRKGSPGNDRREHRAVIHGAVADLVLGEEFSDECLWNHGKIFEDGARVGRWRYRGTANNRGCERRDTASACARAVRLARKAHDGI